MESVVERRKRRGAGLVPYGIAMLDDAFRGIAPGDIVLVGGPTGSGKTQFAACVAFNAAKAGKRVCYFALECAEGEIEDRLVWREVCHSHRLLNPQSKITLNYRDWQLGRLEEETAAIEQGHREALAPLFSQITQIHRNESFNIRDFMTAIEFATQPYDLIILDHINFLDFDERDENRALRSAIVSIRSLSFRKKIPIIVLSQLRKFAQYREGCLPDIDDLFGSSDVSKTATEVVIVCRSEDGDKPGQFPTWFYIAKTRNAPAAYGYAGIHSYDVATSGYSPGYQLFRAPRFSKPVEIEHNPPPPFTHAKTKPTQYTGWKGQQYDD